MFASYGNVSHAPNLCTLLPDTGSHYKTISCLLYIFYSRVILLPLDKKKNCNISTQIIEFLFIVGAPVLA